MKKNLYLICFVLCFVFLIAGYTVYKDNTILFLVLAFFTLLSFVLFFKENEKGKSIENIYQRKLTKIKRVYDAILVKNKDLPSLENVYPILVESFDELLKIQEEVTGMILYFEEENSCTFTLLDDKTLYYYVLLEDEMVEPKIMSEIDKKEEKEKTDLNNILEDLDKTMIIQIEKGKTFKISPIRSKQSSISLLNQEESIKDCLENCENKMDLPKLKENS